MSACPQSSAPPRGAIFIFVIFVAWLFRRMARLLYVPIAQPVPILVRALPAIVVVLAASSASLSFPASSAAESWWHSLTGKYRYRHQLTVTNPDAVNAAQPGYSLMAEIDHAALVNAGKSAADGHDLRVLYYDTTASPGAELDRTFEQPNELLHLTFDGSTVQGEPALGRALFEGDFGGNIKALWHLDESASPLASAVGVFNGTNNGATLSQADASFGKSVLLGVNTAYIEFGQVPRPSPGTGLTLEAWVKPTISNPAGYVSVVGETNGFGFRMFHRAATPIGDYWVFFVELSDGTEYYVRSAVPVTLDRWVHLVGTCDPANSSPRRMRLFMDGQLVASRVVNSTAAIATVLVADRFRIGSTSGVSGSLLNGFIGYVDEVALYHMVLSDTSTPSIQAVAQHGVVYDQSMHQFVATAVGGAIGSVRDAGQAVQLDGAGAYLRVPFQKEFNTITNNLTLEARVRPDQAGQNAALVSRWDETSTAQQAWELGLSNGVPTFRIWTGSAPMSVSATAALPVGSWSHLMAVADNSTPPSLKLYVNGSLVNRVVWPGVTTINTPDTHVLIGARWNGNSTPIGFFKGAIDEVAVFAFAGSPEMAAARAALPALPPAGLVTNKTRVWFPHKDSTPIAANGSSAKYWLAYGSSDPDGGLQDPSAIFKVFDDFTGDTVGNTWKFLSNGGANNFYDVQTGRMLLVSFDDTSGSALESLYAAPLNSVVEGRFVTPEGGSGSVGFYAPNPPPLLPTAWGCRNDNYAVVLQQDATPALGSFNLGPDHTNCKYASNGNWVYTNYETLHNNYVNVLPFVSQFPFNRSAFYQIGRVRLSATTPTRETFLNVGSLDPVHFANAQPQVNNTITANIPDANVPMTLRFGRSYATNAGLEVATLPIDWVRVRDVLPKEPQITYAAGEETGWALATSGAAAFSVRADTDAQPFRAIAITDTAGVITAVKDIILEIPSTLEMQWDTNTFTSAQVTGTGADKLESTKFSVDGSGKQLTVKVGADFTAGDTLQIDGLRVKVTAINLTGDRIVMKVFGGGPSDPGVKDSGAPVVISEGLELANHSAGQIGENFTAAAVASPPFSDVELFRFTLTARGGAAQVGLLTFPLSDVANLPTTSFVSNSIKLKEGSTEIATGSVTSGTSSITFQTPVSLSLGAHDLSVYASFIDSLPAGAKMTMSLPVADIATQPIGAPAHSALPYGSVSSATHNLLSAYLVSKPAAGESIAVGTTYPITWSLSGSAANPVKIEYSTDGTTYRTEIDSYVPREPSPGPYTYPWPVRGDVITTSAKIRITPANSAGVGVGYSGGTVLGNTFNITGGIQITSPGTDARYTDGKPRWPVGSPQTISWTTAGTMTSYHVYVSADGSSWTQITPAAGTTATSISYTPTGSSETATVKVTDNTAGHPLLEVTKPVIFSRLSLVSPNSGDLWPIGSSKTILWGQTGLQKVDLYFSPDGTAFTRINGTPISANPGAYDWVVRAEARSPASKIRIVDAALGDPTDPSATKVIGPSSGYKVYGQLQVTAPSGGSLAVKQPTTITWTTTPAGSVPRVSVYLLNASTGELTPIPGAGDISNVGSIPWEPTPTMPRAQVRVCDKDFPNTDDQACATSGEFSIGGIAVTSPSGTVMVGEKAPVSWNQVGDGGPVDIKFYPHGHDGAFRTIATGYNTGPTGTYVYPDWKALDDEISANAVMCVQSGAAEGCTPIFIVSGRLTVTGPAAGSSYAVDDTLPLRWDTLGAIDTVKISYSKDNWYSETVLEPSHNNLGSERGVANIRITLDMLSDNLKLRVSDTNPAHPVTYADAGPFVIGAKFTFTSPLGAANPQGAERWAVNTVQPVSWNVVGQGVTSVMLEYATEASGYAAWTSLGTFPNSGSSGSINWRVLDLVPSPQQDRDVKVKFRISDATANHPPVPQASPEFEVIYYVVTWYIRDSETRALLWGLSVNETGSNWQIFNGSLVSTGPKLGDPTGTIRAYPFGTYSTGWSETGYDSASLENWTADGDKDLTVYMESGISAQIPWKVNTSYEYEEATKTVQIIAYLERREQLVNPAMLGGATVKLYDGTSSNPIATLTAAAPSSGGEYRLAWDASAAVPNVTYFGKAGIVYNGTTYTSGGTFNILIPQAIQQLEATVGTTGGGSGGSGSGGGTGDAALAQDVATIKTAVTSALPNQIAVAQSAIQGNVTASKDQLAGAIAEVKTDTETLKAGTSDLKNTLDTQVVPKVTAILSDPNAGLPKLQQMITQHDTDMKDKIKTLRRGGLLTRDMEVEQGQTVTIQYRSEGGALLFNVYDATGAAMSVPALVPGPSSGIFQSSFTLSGLGEYRVVVNEQPSDNSAGTIDGITLTVREPRATAQNVSDLTTQLTNLQAEVGVIDTHLNGLIQTAAVIQTKSDETRTIAGQLQTDLQSLSGKWGTLDAAQLKTELENLSRQVGTPAQTSDVQGAVTQLSQQIAAIPGAIDYGARFNQIDSALTALQTSVNAIASCSGSNCPGGGDVTVIQNTLTQLATDVAGLRTQVNQPAQAADMQTALGRLDMLQQDLTTVKSSMGSPAQATALQAIADQLSALQGAVGQIPQAADYAPQLTALQTQLTTLQAAVGRPSQEADVAAKFATLEGALSDLKTQIGTPSQANALVAVANQLSIVDGLIRAIPPAADYAQQLTELKTKMEALQLAASTTAQGSALASVADKVDALEPLIRALPPAANYGTQLTRLQDDLNQVVASVGSPAQAARMQQALEELQQLQRQIAAIPGSTDYAGDFQAINTALTALQQALDSVPKTDYAPDLTALKASMTTVEQSVAALPTSSGAASSDSTLLAKLDEIQKAVESAQGSSAAISYSQTASAAAQEALTLLRQLQADIKAGAAGQAPPLLLSQVQQKLADVSSAVTVIPGKITADEIRAELKKVVEQAKAVSSDKGYNFDALYETSETQAGDVKSVRNQVEQLKSLLEVQRNILEQNLNQPVVKTWFETGY